jgi:hypothetical protein
MRSLDRTIQYKFREITLMSQGKRADMSYQRWNMGRLLCSDMVQIEWKAFAGWDSSALSLLEEISPTGASILTDTPIPVDSAVRIRCGEKTLEGIVRSCAHSDLGHSVAMEFNADQQWSPRVFRPKHLLDVQNLKGLVRREVPAAPAPLKAIGLALSMQSGSATS